MATEDQFFFIVFFFLQYRDSQPGPLAYKSNSESHSMGILLQLHKRVIREK